MYANPRGDVACAPQTRSALADGFSACSNKASNSTRSCVKTTGSFSSLMRAHKSFNILRSCSVIDPIGHSLHVHHHQETMPDQNINTWLAGRTEQRVNRTLSGKRCRTNYSLWSIPQMHLRVMVTSRLMPLPQRRIEDRIRELCVKAVTSTEPDLEPALQELSQLLRGTIQHMRESATRLLVEGTSLSEPRRRANDNEV